MTMLLKVHPHALLRCNAHFIVARVTRIDAEQRKIAMCDGEDSTQRVSMSYDFLSVDVGSRTAGWNIPG